MKKQQGPCELENNYLRLRPESSIRIHSGEAEFFLELPEGKTSVVLDNPGQYVKASRNTWHMTITSVEITMLLMTAREGTRIRPV